MMIECKETRTRLYTVTDMTESQRQTIYEGLVLLNLDLPISDIEVKELMVLFK